MNAPGSVCSILASSPAEKGSSHTEGFDPDECGESLGNISLLGDNSSSSGRRSTSSPLLGATGGAGALVTGGLFAEGSSSGTGSSQASSSSSSTPATSADARTVGLCAEGVGFAGTGTASHRTL